MRKVSMAVAVLLGLAALLVAGCGGSSSSEASVPPIAKALFVKKATAICKAVNESATGEGFEVLQEIESETGKSTHAAEVVFIPKWLVPTGEAEIEEIRSLGMPKGEEAQTEAFFAALQEVFDEAKADPSKYLNRQVYMKHPYKKAEKLATELGIQACGQP